MQGDALLVLVENSTKRTKIISTLGQIGFLRLYLLSLLDHQNCLEEKFQCVHNGYETCQCGGVCAASSGLVHVDLGQVSEASLGYGEDELLGAQFEPVA